jgi:uncharacterized protein (DUF302 family)
MKTSVVSIGSHVSMRGAYKTIYEQVQMVLKAAGFDILAEIDLTELLAKTAGSHIQPHRIIVICDPQLAHRALTIAPQIDVVMPCNVAVSQLQDDRVAVRIVSPLVTCGLTTESYLKPIAEELNQRLERIIAVLQEQTSSSE